jgi:hypothetical protein
MLIIRSAFNCLLNPMANSTEITKKDIKGYNISEDMSELNFVPFIKNTHAVNNNIPVQTDVKTEKYNAIFMCFMV